MAATVVSNELFGAPGMSDPVVFHPGLVGITRKVSFAAAHADASKAYAFIAVPKGFVITGLFAEETEACKAGTLTFKIADAADSANDKAVGSAVTVGGSAPARVAQNLATPVVANEGAIVSLISSVAQTDGTVDVAIYGYTPWGDSLGNVVTPDYRASGQTEADAEANRAGEDPFLTAQAAKTSIG